MSQVLIHRYLDDLADLKRLSGTDRETVVREAFKTLLKGWARPHELKFIPEYPLTTANNDKRYIDGALVDPIRIPFGFWEAKDMNDNLDKQIELKFSRGYPQDNIIFEDSSEAVLIQNKKIITRCGVDDVPNLETLLHKFFAFENPQIAKFRRAVSQFSNDLPEVLRTLRSMIDLSFDRNDQFRASAERFLKHAKQTIHPTVSADDVREMLIQHILTEDIFAKVFGDDDFHRKNNIAKLLYQLEATFFTGDVKWQTLKTLAPYYSAIHSAAVEVRGHHEKQAFLKVVYEKFYTVYNKKLADKLGVVYTPNEIVRFMVSAADQLCLAHFNKRLIEKNVEILEPSVGTGTFVTELIDFFRRHPAKLKHKYLEEIHANEIAILPYYVANLNIEATYASLMKEYVEFPNLCFVDTIDSVEGLGKFSGHQDDLFGKLSEENYTRIKRQNQRKISVAIGNPPYNANQISENDDNKNRKYPRIDARIKGTYIARSKAQKTKQYDMYVRFFRWASDRIHDAGIIAFITNRSFIDSGNFDGFRKAVAEEFDEIYLIDLGGDWKKAGAAGGGNVFGIGTGVAIGFWIRKSGEKKNAKIRYIAAPEGSGEEKLSWLDNLDTEGKTFDAIDFKEIAPEDGYWIDHPEHKFSSEIPIASKDVKQAKRTSSAHALFRLFSLGVSTNRDEWLYDLDQPTLEKKVKLLISGYAAVRSGTKKFPDTIKWSETLKRRKSAAQSEDFAKKRIRRVAYRPFVDKWLYKSPLFIDRPGLIDQFFPVGRENIAICFSDVNSRADYCVLATDRPTDLHFGASSDGYQQVTKYHYEGADRFDNITDWALKQFKLHYEKDGKKLSHPITKDAIFNYVYGVLYDPTYREKYAQNLKRAFPQIPMYADFWRWSEWGAKLLKLHLGYEDVAPLPLKRREVVDKVRHKAELKPSTILKADIADGSIRIDSQTSLTGIPAAAWQFRLGNRSALEWILDQYRDSKFNSKLLTENIEQKRFAAHKEHVIDLLCKIARVSVETRAIVDEMQKWQTR